MASTAVDEHPSTSSASLVLDVEALEELFTDNGLNGPKECAAWLDVDRTYLWRLVKRKRQPGADFVAKVLLVVPEEARGRVFCAIFQPRKCIDKAA